MALIRKGKISYADSQADIRDEILRYSRLNGYPASQFADAVCQCGGRLFRLFIDDVEGVAIRVCPTCLTKTPMADSQDYLDGATPEECACPCSGEVLEVTLGISLYENSEDVRWLYVGCRCPKCKQAGVYGDWKNEFKGYKTLLSRA